MCFITHSKCCLCVQVGDVISTLVKTLKTFCGVTYHRRTGTLDWTAGLATFGLSLSLIS